MRHSHAIEGMVPLVLVLVASAASAEPSPSAGTISPEQPSVTWTGGNISGANQTHDDLCDVEKNISCETFALTVSGGEFHTGMSLVVDLNWSLQGDYDIYIYEGGQLLGSGENGFPTFSETATVALGHDSQSDRLFTIRVVASIVTPGNNYLGRASLKSGLLSRADCSLSNTSLWLEQGDPYAPANNLILEIPVFVHVLRSGTGLGDLSDAMIESQIDVLNEDFRGDPDPNHTNVRLQFRLAGITRSTSDFWFQDLTDPVRGDYWDALARDPRHFLNIYTNNAQLQSNTAGYPASCRAIVAGSYCGYPQEGGVGGVSDRVVMTFDNFGRPGMGIPGEHKGHFTTHELGHYFGLYHTFVPQSGVLCPTAARPGCYSDGDLICDTEPHAFPSGGVCVAEQDPQQCGDPDPTHNYMNYVTDLCYNQFTPEQARRMRCTLEHYRPELGDVVVVAGTDRKVSGGGQLSGDPVFGVGGSLLSLPAISASASGGGAEANFAFLVRGGSVPSGNLNYRDKSADTTIKATAFDSFEIVGDTHARLRGTATVNGFAGKRFEVELDDAGEASGDAISIRILEDGGYRNGGPLLHGNVRID